MLDRDTTMAVGVTRYRDVLAALSARLDGAFN